MYYSLFKLYKSDMESVTTITVCKFGRSQETKVVPAEENQPVPSRVRPNHSEQ